MIDIQTVLIIFILILVAIRLLVSIGSAISSVVSSRSAKRAMLKSLETMVGKIEEIEMKKGKTPSRSRAKK